MIRQRTLKTVVRATGVGRPHRAARSRWCCVPRPSTRASCSAAATCPAIPRFPRARPTSPTRRWRPCIEKDGARVSTVEHLMSAFAGLGIDNAFVDVSAEEVPIMDGSAGTFVFLIQQAGIEEQAAPKRYIRVLKRVEAEQGDKKVWLEPFDGFKVAFLDRVQPSRVRRAELRSRDRLRRRLLHSRGVARAHVRLHAGRGGDARQGPGPRRLARQRRRDRRLPRAERRRACAWTTSS